MKIITESCFMAILFSSLLSIGIHLFRRKYRLNRLWEQKILLLLYTLCFIRLLFPLDFSFTYGIDLSGIYSDIIYWLSIYRLPAPFLPLSFAELLCGLFFLTAAVHLIRFTRKCRLDYFLLKQCTPWSCTQLERVQHRIGEVLPALPKAAVYRCPFSSMPFAVSIFRKTIYLPNIDYEDDQLFFILLHEYIHLRRHDTTVKFLSNIFYCFFWWLPFASAAKTDVEQALELGCDMEIARLLPQSRHPFYMTALLSEFKRSNTQKENSLHTPLSMCFALQEKSGQLSERFRMIAENAPKSRCLSYAVMGIILCIFFSTYFFTFLPSYLPDSSEIEEDGFLELTPENSFLLKLGDDYYFAETTKTIKEALDTKPIDPALVDMILNDGFKLKEISEKDVEKN